MDKSIRAVTENDIAIWFALAKESEAIIKDLIQDTSVFYEGFDTYMQAKIRQQEAFMAWEPGAGCMGIIAFSRRHNRITFLGVFEGNTYREAGAPLMEFALRQLDGSKEITSTVLKGSHPRLVEERQFYEHYGFQASGDTMEAGVPAIVMKRLPLLSENNR